MTRRCCVLLGVTTLVAAACSGSTRAELTATTSTTLRPAEYVALGDSYTSGPHIPVQVGVPGCRRSDHNYPSLVALAIGATPFRDASCSGATVEHMTASQDTGSGVNPPQLDALTPSTDLVTIGVGGNDLGFGDIVARCTSAIPVGAPCQAQFVVRGRDELAERTTVVAAKVQVLLGAVRARAPKARVVVVGYPGIVPDTGAGCWPVLPFTAQDVPYVRATIETLNRALRTVAESAGTTFVDVDGPSTGHDACSAPALRWVEPVAPSSQAAPLHPNATGMTAVASIVTLAVKAQRP